MSRNLPPASIKAPRTAWRSGATHSGSRVVAEEIAIAFVYNGACEAVMMATPLDLEDFAVGFSLTEGIAQSPQEICSLEIANHTSGIELRMELAEQPLGRAIARRRHRAGPAGCGLCGIESLESAMRALPPVISRAVFDRSAIEAGMRLVADDQRLNDETHAVHAAAFYRPHEQTIIAREDVGRHNALDKVAGALAREGLDACDGILLLTSRVSVELVQKAAMMGAPLIAAVSAPTALALRTAEAAGICVVAIVRADGLEVFTHPERLALTDERCTSAVRPSTSSG